MWIQHDQYSVFVNSYFNRNRRHSSTMMGFQKSVLIFGTESEVMRPPYNFEPYYRVIILTTEVWTSESIVMGLFRYTDGSRTPVGGLRP